MKHVLVGGSEQGDAVVAEAFHGRLAADLAALMEVTRPDAERLQASLTRLGEGLRRVAEANAPALQQALARLGDALQQLLAAAQADDPAEKPA